MTPTRLLKKGIHAPRTSLDTALTLGEGYREIWPLPGIGMKKLLRMGVSKRVLTSLCLVI